MERRFAPGAWKYALGPLVCAPFAFVFSVAGSVGLLALGAAILAFFRDPERTPPPSGIVSAADGTVSVLRAEEVGGSERERTRLGVFMNVWHVHVVRSPFDATVTEVEHVSGAHRPAFSKESDRNERVHVTLELENSSSDGNPRTAEVTFIAGAFARRIHPYVEPGQRLERGERIGHIAFGSRVDVVFPPVIGTEDVRIGIGDSTTAGETVILDEKSFSSNETPISPS